MLNLYKLEIFAAVVQAGSLSAAAERLLMTQPAVSQHIHELEASLGTKLLQRGPRGVVLTSAGETLHRYTRDIFHLVVEAENAVTDVKNLTSGQINLGATPGASVYLLPDWVQEFRSHFPKLVVGLQTGITPQIVAELRAGRIDLGFIEGELEPVLDSWLGVQALQDYDQLVIVGRKHPWWNRTNVALDELREQTFVMRQRNSQTRIWLDGVLRENGIQPKIGAEFDAVESIKRAAMMGSCLTILPEYVVKSEVEIGLLRALPIDGRPLQRTLKLIWNRDGYLTPVVRTFLLHMSGKMAVLRAVVNGGLEVGSGK